MAEILAEDNLRLRSIEWLAGQLDNGLDLNSIKAEETEAKRRHDEYNVTPTIGCEIEVTWSTLFPELAAEYFGTKDVYGRFERTYKELPPEVQAELDERSAVLESALAPRYQATVEAGIPMGSDAFWEFANSPTYSWRTLAAEVSLLFDYGLIPEGNDHSFHVTLGGASATGGGMCLVLSGLELTYIAPERIMAATSDGRVGYESAWARRGQDGLRERDSSVLELGHTAGTELRTFSINSAEQASNLLASAQLLTTVLLAYRQRHTTDNLQVKNLAELWPVYREEIKDVWLAADLPAESWGPPSRNFLKWQKWADCLSRREVEGTVESRAARYITELTAQTQAVIQQL